ncbi:MAG TPA: hypothetical protein VGQ05_09535 [Streptosporangiaceae bacterium]|jgi:hypothetical protein|nr:hypothetical protein [Streptosporangiaceae bacterium]
MFEEKIDAEARILADEGSGSVMNTDFHRNPLPCQPVPEDC